jgi:hypothetical protein
LTAKKRKGEIDEQKEIKKREKCPPNPLKMKKRQRQKSQHFPHCSPEQLFFFVVYFLKSEPVNKVGTA